MRNGLFLSLGLGAILAVSCRDTSTNPDPGRIGVRVFLEREYINYAWGYDHSGWIVDTAGNMISYNIAKAGVTWTPNPGGYYTAEELSAKAHHCDTLRGTVPTDTLQWLRTLAESSVGGAYSDTTHPMVDAGTVTLFCYVYDPDSSKYRQVVLLEYGDYQFSNTAAPAIQLSDWMARQQAWY